MQARVLQPVAAGACVSSVLRDCWASKTVSVAAGLLLQGLPADIDESDVHAAFAGEFCSRPEASCLQAASCYCSLVNCFYKAFFGVPSPLIVCSVHRTFACTFALDVATCLTL